MTLLRSIPLGMKPLHALLHFSALFKNATLFLSGDSTLFAKNTGGTPEPSATAFASIPRNESQLAENKSPVTSRRINDPPRAPAFRRKARLRGYHRNGARASETQATPRATA